MTGPSTLKPTTRPQFLNGAASERHRLLVLELFGGAGGRGGSTPPAQLPTEKPRLCSSWLPHFRNQPERPSIPVILFLAWSLVVLQDKISVVGTGLGLEAYVLAYHCVYLTTAANLIWTSYTRSMM